MMHVAIIPDGNRRWAWKHGVSLEEAYKRGIDRFFSIAKFLRRKDVREVTVWAFSTENFQRKEEEKKTLWRLFELYLKQGLERMDGEKEVRVRFIGRLHLFPKHLQEMMAEVMAETKDRGPYVVNFLMGYGGKAEVVDGVSALLKACPKGDPERLVEDYFYTGPLSEVDIIVRYGGEMRLSGFLPIKGAYAELFFLRKLWPDADEKDFEEILKEFKERERRFGR